MSIPTTPAAPVDPDGPPPEVRTAFRLYVAQLALGLVGFVVTFLTLPSLTRVAAQELHRAGKSTAGAHSLVLAGLAVLAGFTLVLLAIQLFVLFRMRAGRNWARVVIVAISALQVVLLAFGIEQLGAEFSAGALGVLSALLRILSVVLVVVASVFLFRPAAGDWFRSQ